jgi:hypothetical protein
VSLIFTVGICLIAVADDGAERYVPDKYERTYLDLVSQESLPNWSPAWTGPIEAATALAWLYDNSYTKLLQDLNADGIVDVLDTIQLADQLGKGAMQTATPKGTNDIRLVVGLARYVAERYPGEFELKIYDTSFQEEYNAEGIGAFAADAVPGIRLTLLGNPTIGAYKSEMEAGEAVIVGLETTAGQNNTYFSGRSYLFEPTSDGYTAIDLAWAAEDLWTPGPQGQVLNALGKATDRFYLTYHEAWTPVECMLALSPVVKPSAASAPRACPSDAIAKDVQVAAEAPYGSIRIEECVTRTSVGGVVYDTYTYTVTNIDYTNTARNSDGTSVEGGLGLFWVYLGTPVSVVKESAPPLWHQSGGRDSWLWLSPKSDRRGVQPGESAVFSVTVVGPTQDGPATGYGGSVFDVDPGLGGGYWLVPRLVTTGPVGVEIPATGACCLPNGTCEALTSAACTAAGGTYQGDTSTCASVQCALPSCLDLTVTGTGKCTAEFCGADLTCYVLTLDATVYNTGTSSATQVKVKFETALGEKTETIPSIAGGSHKHVSVSFQQVFTKPSSGAWSIEVDPTNKIVECNENNNEDSGRCNW